MRKLLIVASMCALSLLFTGCGGPKLPDDTVAAAYVDLELALGNAVDFIETAIAELPDSAKDKAKKLLKDNIDKFEDDIDEIEPEWLLAFVCCKDLSKDPNFGVVIKCNYEAKVSQMANAPFKELMTGGGAEYKEINGEKVYCANGMLFTFISGKYVLMSDFKQNAVKSSEEFLRRLIALYRDGDGETSGDFDDIDDLDDGAVVRIKTAEVGTVADLLGVRKMIEELGEKSDDKDLAEDILDIGSLTVDIVFGGDEIGTRIEFDAGSSQFAKVVEGVLNAYALFSRVAVDVAAGMSNMFGGFLDKDAAKFFSNDSGKDLAELLREAPEVDRSGSIVTFEGVVDTEDLMELIVPQIKDDISSFLDNM